MADQTAAAKIALQRAIKALDDDQPTMAAMRAWQAIRYLRSVDENTEAFVAISIAVDSKL
jgi:hypothetical protein